MPFWFLLFAALSMTVIRSNIILDTSFDRLAQVPEDDSFYYLEPSWNFHTYGLYTFDGINPTYGWQPLWMLVITFISSLCDSKYQFLQYVMILSSFFYYMTAPLLYCLLYSNKSHRRLVYVFCILLLWVFNWRFTESFCTGKENALYAFLLVAFLLYHDRIRDRFSSEPHHTYVFGFFAGILFLCRINALVLLPIVLFSITVSNFRCSHEIWKGVLRFLTGYCVPVLSWGLYAVPAYGSLMPTSGVLKLGHSGYLAALKYLRPDKFVKSFSIFKDIVSEYIVYAEGSPRYRAVATLFLFAVLVVILAGAIHLVKTTSKTLKERDPRVVNKMIASPLFVLTALAFANLLATYTLLHGYFFFGRWYHVPEYLVAVIIVSHFFAHGLDVIDSHWPKIKHKIIIVAAMSLCCVIAIYPLYHRYRRGYYFVGYNSHTRSVLELRNQLLNLLGASEPIGVFNAGRYGYLLDPVVVINLDGLANSLEFAKSLSINHSNIWHYLKQWKVRYIMDEMTDDNTPRLQYWDMDTIIPPESYEVVLQSTNSITYAPWRVTLVKIKDSWLSNYNSHN